MDNCSFICCCFFREWKHHTLYSNVFLLGLIKFFFFFFYKEIRKSLAHIDWDEKMKNKTATECWDILRGELDTAIDRYVPMKNQGKRSKKKHLSKGAFRKMRY